MATRLAILGASAMFLSACSGGDAEQRVDLPQKPEFASTPIETPETEGAVWSELNDTGSLRFGVPGAAPLFTIQCTSGTITLTRHAPADLQASALMPLIGNGPVVRLPVDAVQSGEGPVWQGEFPANDVRLKALIGSRSIEATVPGAGSIDLAANAQIGALITNCRQNSQQQPQLQPQATPQPAE